MKKREGKESKKRRGGTNEDWKPEGEKGGEDPALTRSMRSSLTRRALTERDCKAPPAPPSSPPQPRPSSCPPRPSQRQAGRQLALRRRHVPAPVKRDSSGCGHHRPGLGRRAARGAQATRPACAGLWLGRRPGARAGAGSRGEAGGRAAGRHPRSVPHGPRGIPRYRAAARAGPGPGEPDHACAARCQGLLQSHREQPRSAAPD